jgi:ribonuclease HII
VYAAAVILDARRPVRGLDDSKRLAESVRLALADRIRSRALAWAVASATVAEIDALNILRASLLAMKRAIEGLAVIPQRVLVDGLHCPDVRIPAEAIVGGDATVKAISAASILAKTERDAEMVRLHQHFPAYGFDRHKGYPTPEHLAALRRLGPCAAHRGSLDRSGRRSDQSVPPQALFGDETARRAPPAPRPRGRHGALRRARRDAGGRGTGLERA